MPALQSVPALRPEAAHLLPAGQATQDVDEDLSWYWPATQDVHAEVPPVEKVPDAQAKPAEFPAPGQ